MLNLIVRMKNGDTVNLTHPGTMNDFMLGFLREGALTADHGIWLPRENISHIVPQIVPLMPGEVAAAQVPPTAERPN